jgi:hypothetical protein
MFVPAGSRLTWAGDFGDLAFFAASSTDQIAAVGGTLKNNYNLIVERAHDGVGGFANLSGGTITLDLRSEMDRGNGSNGVDDIRGNVADAFAFWGSACAASRIISTNLVPSKAGQPIVQNTGPQDTGAPKEAPNPPAPDNTSSSWSTWWDNLTGKIEAGSIGLVLGGAIVIGLVLYLSVKSAATV